MEKTFLFSEKNKTDMLIIGYTFNKHHIVSLLKQKL